MIIRHNMMASNMHLQLNIINKKSEKSYAKLSSGFSINRAADNAAGLTISEKMRSQIRGLNQASRNVQDGISYVQVADGALSEVQAILHRIGELSVEAANDTYTELDRMEIDEEIQELKVEISRIFTDTEFNTIKIWEPNPATRVQIGTEILPAVTISNRGTSGKLNEINKEAIPSSVGYDLVADVNGITVNWKGYNGKQYSSKNIEWPKTLKGSHSFKLSDYIDTGINPELSGLDFTFSYNVIEAATLDNVISSINGKVVYCSPSTSVWTNIYSDDGSAIPGISFSPNIRYHALLASNKNFDTYDDLFIEGSVGGVLNEKNLVVDPTETYPSDKWVFEFEMPEIGTVKATSYSTSYYSPWKDPDKNWWYTDAQGNDYTRLFSPSPNDGSLSSVHNSLVNGGLDLLNDTGGVGGYIRVLFDIRADSPYELKDGVSRTDVGDITMLIQVFPDDTPEKVYARLNKLTGVDIYAGNKTTNEPSNSNYYALKSQEDGVLIESPIYQSAIDIKIQSGANTGQSINISYNSLNNYCLGINNTNILTREAAGNAISQAANAVSIVSEQRSLFGAYQNRLEHAKSNIDNMSENTQNSESKIRDADMAQEILEFSKNKILQEVTHSLLSQAGKMPERVLNLLD